MAPLRDEGSANSEGDAGPRVAAQWGAACGVVTIWTEGDALCRRRHGRAEPFGVVPVRIRAAHWGRGLVERSRPFIDSRRTTWKKAQPRAEVCD